LFGNLKKHPYVAPPIKKEIRFFDQNFERGILWYRSHFPLSVKKLSHLLRQKNIITGEATPNYIFHPCAAQRIAKNLPKVKLIAMLRNPVDRAYSHYHLALRNKHEDSTFEQAVEAEMKELSKSNCEALGDIDCSRLNVTRHSYLTRGIYAFQLKKWFTFFPRSQILVIKSEDYFIDEQSEFTKVVQFIGLPLWVPSKFELFKEPYLKEYHMYEDGSYPPMSSQLRQRLFEFFEPYNQGLYSLLGINLHWES
jgi:hypothetical protein